MGKAHPHITDEFRDRILAQRMFFVATAPADAAALVQSVTHGPHVWGVVVEVESDLPACAALCERVHRFPRGNELRGALAHFRPFVLLRGGRVTAYASAPHF